MESSSGVAVQIGTDKVDEKSDSMNHQSTRDFIRELTGDHSNEDSEKARDGSGDTIVHRKDPLIGQTLGHLEILSLLGEGGMSRVYKALDHSFQRPVAIKVMKPHIFADERAMRRFQQEAIAVGKLSHPNIINVYSRVDLPSGEPGIVMEFAPGRSLSDLIELRGALEVERVIEIMHQACSALIHAHRAGIIHRDLKPSNLMLIKTDSGGDAVKVVDFGIAKISQENSAGSALTQTGEIFGSPLYMSPEQCAGRQLDARSDIYSLGCVMYEALTGEPPVRGVNVFDTLQRQANELPKPVEAIKKNIACPDALNHVLTKALAKEPGKRFQTMAEFSTALDELKSVLIDGKTLRLPVQRKKRVSPVMTAVAAVGALALAAGGFTVFRSLSSSHTVTPQAKARSTESTEKTAAATQVETSGPRLLKPTETKPVETESPKSKPNAGKKAAEIQLPAKIAMVKPVSVKLVPAKPVPAKPVPAKPLPAKPLPAKSVSIPTKHVPSLPHLNTPATTSLGKQQVAVSLPELCNMNFEIQSMLDTGDYKNALNKIRASRHYRTQNQVESSRWKDSLDELEFEALTLTNAANANDRWGQIQQSKQKERAAVNKLFNQRISEPYNAATAIDICKLAMRASGVSDHRMLNPAPIEQLQSYADKANDAAVQAVCSYYRALYSRDAGSTGDMVNNLTIAAKSLDKTMRVDPLFGARLSRMTCLLLIDKNPGAVRGLLTRTAQVLAKADRSTPTFREACANIDVAEATYLVKQYEQARGKQRDKANLATANNYYSEAIAFGKNKKLYDLVAISYAGIGDILFIQKNFKDSSESYLQSLQFDEREIPMPIYAVRNGLRRMLSMELAPSQRASIEARFNVMNKLVK